MAAKDQGPSASAPSEDATQSPAKTTNKTITCHCKAIRITFPPPREAACECLCSICRRYGALWTYYQEDEVHVEVQDDAMEGYSWGRKALRYNRCKRCGCMTHYTVIDATQTEPRVAVNCRMLSRREYKELDREESEGEGDDVE